MVNLFNPPPSFTLPLVMGSDLVLSLTYRQLKTDGVTYENADWPANSVVTLVIDSQPASVTSVADIVAEVATIGVESTVTDGIAPGLQWRLIVNTGATWDQVIAHGLTQRSDT